MLPFEVRVLGTERTFSEKIMSLVRFSYTDNPYDNLSQKIRHVYDLHMILRNDEMASFFNSNAFYEMINAVGNDDMQGFKNNNQWLAYHPAEALIFKFPADTWNKIRRTYQTTFKDMVTGWLPSEEDLIATLNSISKRLENINWNVKCKA